MDVKHFHFGDLFDNDHENQCVTAEDGDESFYGA